MACGREDRGRDAIGRRPLVRGLAPDRDPRYLLTSRHVWSNATHLWGPGWSGYRSGRRHRGRCRLARGHFQRSAEAHGSSAAQRRALVRGIRFPNAVQYGEGVSDDRALRRPIGDRGRRQARFTWLTLAAEWRFGGRAILKSSVRV